MTVKSDDLGGGGSISIIDTAPASNTDLVVGDYFTGVEMGTTKQASDVTIASIDAGGVNYNTWTLNATGLANINKTGVTPDGLRVTRDNDDSEPTWASNERQRIIVIAADTSGTSTDPKLVVVYTTPVTFTPRATIL